MKNDASLSLMKFVDKSPSMYHAISNLSAMLKDAGFIELKLSDEFKLKKGFKEIFGTTIYAALQNERLKIAKELLLSGDINVSEAANIVGYKSLGHFGQAFKSYYGALPTQIKKR